MEQHFVQASPIKYLSTFDACLLFPGTNSYCHPIVTVCFRADKKLTAFVELESA
jgi:hypothetical protein